MKSKLTIDFRGIDVMPSGQQFEPVIRVGIEDSDDVRDGLVKAFFEALAHRSNWLRADFNSHEFANTKSESVIITPIKPGEILTSMSTMISRVPIEEARAWLKAQENLYNTDLSEILSEILLEKELNE